MVNFAFIKLPLFSHRCDSFTVACMQCWDSEATEEIRKQHPKLPPAELWNS